MPQLNRRALLKNSVALAAATSFGSGFAAPLIAKPRSLRISSYGGYFENSFKEHIFPAFTAATGIEVESITQATSPDWLVTMQQAVASGKAPTDVLLFSRDIMIKASRIGGIIKALDPKRIPGAANLESYYVFEDSSGPVGVGAMSWFVSMVINPQKVDAQPTSWADFWDTSRFEASLGLGKQFNSSLLDIIAATFFEGESTFDTVDGIVAMVEKAAELKPNVALWWNTESQMEQALKNDDVVAGTYFHDVAQLMAADGFPIKSIFPKEGNPQEYGSWCLSAISSKDEEAAEFINFSCDPTIQALMSRKIGTAPLVDPAKTDLTKAEFEAVSGTPVIHLAYQAYLDKETLIKETWEKMLGS